MDFLSLAKIPIKPVRPIWRKETPKNCQWDYLCNIVFPFRHYAVIVGDRSLIIRNRMGSRGDAGAKLQNNRKEMASPPSTITGFSSSKHLQKNWKKNVKTTTPILQFEEPGEEHPVSTDKFHNKFSMMWNNATQSLLFNNTNSLAKAFCISLDWS
jgi:hypothetical protein